MLPRRRSEKVELLQTLAGHRPGLQKKILVALCERLRAADAALASVN
jgi:hypothetical protein